MKGIEGQISLFDILEPDDSSSGKTYQEHSVPIREKTSEQYWKRFVGSTMKPSLFLDLRKGSGQMPDASSVTDSQSHGESSMPSSGVCLSADVGFALSLILTDIGQQTSYSNVLNTSAEPNEPNPTKLSQILEWNVDPKYNLSAKACMGIIRRARKRKKKLPPLLKEALMEVIHERCQQKLAELHMKLSQCKTDAESQGGGKGPLIQIERSATLSCSNNQILIAEEPMFFDTSHADDVVRCDSKVSPIEARDFKGGKNICMCVPEVVKGDGAYGGEKTFAIVGDHENRPTDMTNLVIYTRGFGGTTTEDQIVPTILAASGEGGNNQPIIAYNDRIAGTLDASYYKGCGMRAGIEREVVIAIDRAAYNQGANAKFDFYAEESQFPPPIIARGPGAVCYETVALEGNGQRPSHKGDGYKVSDQSYTLNTTEVHGVAYETYQDVSGTLMANSHPGSYSGQDAYNDMLVTGVKAVDCWNSLESDVNGTLQASCYRNNNSNNVVRYRKIVRRLTEKECERLQGYPDGWTDIPDYIDSKGKTKKASASAIYKALGNSIALPSWRWVMKRISAVYERPATLASLFDGIGGFPLIWEQINGPGTCLWASEIEDFPMAVTKYRFGAQR